MFGLRSCQTFCLYPPEAAATVLTSVQMKKKGEDCKDVTDRTGLPRWQVSGDARAGVTVLQLTIGPVGVTHNPTHDTHPSV